jgi:hypothetical protein
MTPLEQALSARVVELSEYLTAARAKEMELHDDLRKAENALDYHLAVIDGMESELKSARHILNVHSGAHAPRSETDC